MNKDNIPLCYQYEMYLLELMLNDIEETYELRTMSYEEFLEKKNTDMVEINNRTW